VAKTDTTDDTVKTDALATPIADDGAQPDQVHTNASALALATKAHDIVEKALLEAWGVVSEGVHDELSSSRSSIRTLLYQWRACWPGGKPKVVAKEDELSSTSLSSVQPGGTA
jgi:hypothetical protein